MTGRHRRADARPDGHWQNAALCTHKHEPGQAGVRNLGEVHEHWVARHWPEPPPRLSQDEGDDAYTNRVLGISGWSPYDHYRQRQCSIGWHGECTDPEGARCKCPCHTDVGALELAVWELQEMVVIGYALASDRLADHHRPISRAEWKIKLMAELWEEADEVIRGRPRLGEWYVAPLEPVATITVTVWYHGTGGHDVAVEREDGTLVEALPHVSRHSPTGFSWGYGGSGPADLARSLLIHALGPRALCKDCKGTRRVVWLGSSQEPLPFDDAAKTAIQLMPEVWADRVVERCASCDDGYRMLPYQDYKFGVVAGWGDEWRVSSAEILTWLYEHGGVPDA